AYCPWQEICDSSTGYSYYWNVQTNEVTWDCPPEYATYIQSFNTSTEKTNHAAQNDKNTDGKEKKKKKSDTVVPEGAIIPISYFGNSSSDDSSDSESELSKKKPNSEKVSELKKNKIIKKVDSRSKTNEGESSEIIGPSLPPDFQFPVTESAANETDSLMTVSQNEVHEFVKVGPSLPPETLNDIIEKPSQSDLDEFPAESSTHETSWENSLKVTEKRCAELNEKAGDASPDSTEKKGENSLIRNAYQVSNSTYGFRPVVEYDSFTDEDEEICVANISSSKTNTDEKNYEVKSSSQQEQENTTESSTSTKMLVETESKISSFKRKASEVLIESTKKEELIKKPKRNDVNIDSLFASHSSYGKYGFGFGWQKQLDEQNEELCSTSNQDYKTHKHQSEFKTVSFVKSEDILDLRALNDEIVCDETNHALPDGSVQTNTECDQSNALEQNEKPLLNNEELVENAEANENIKISSDYDVGSSSMISIKDKIDCSILSRKKKNGKFLFNAASTSLKVEDDLDEIDKALCEALDAKKSAKNLSLKSSSPVSDVSNTPKNMLESTSTISGGKFKEAVKNDVLDVEILWTLKTVKNHGSYKVNEDIEKMLHRMFPDSAIASKILCTEKKTAYYAAFGITPYLENLLQENLNKKNFLLLFDESLNIMRQEKQMDIHVWQKYMKYLEDQKLLSSQNKKRKSITSDEIQELRNKKRCLEKDIKALIRSADEFAEKAEENNVTSICKSNSLRRSAKAKEEKSLEITNAIEDLEKKIG
ncbi:hypothetical protein AVEN_133852-1, partial [Araneus ventricosus]